MARPFKHIRTVPWKLRIPVDVAGAIEEMYMNPLTHKPRYGSKSELISDLLRRHLKEQTDALAQLETNS